jgi:hypothetical protein
MSDMTQEEIQLWNLIERYVNPLGFRMDAIEPHPAGLLVKLTSIERDVKRSIVVTPEAFRETITNQQLSKSIILNLDAEFRMVRNQP